MTPEVRAEKLESFGKASAMLSDALLEFPASMWTYRPATGRWTVEEIVHHLADSEAIMWARCRTAIAEPGKAVMAYDQDKWVASLTYPGRSVKESLEIFRLLRKTSAELFRSLPPATWNNAMVQHPEHGAMSLDRILEVYEKHVRSHVEQMRKVFADWQQSGQGRG